MSSPAKRILPRTRPSTLNLCRGGCCTSLALGPPPHRPPTLHLPPPPRNGSTTSPSHPRHPPLLGDPSPSSLPTVHARHTHTYKVLEPTIPPPGATHLPIPPSHPATAHSFPDPSRTTRSSLRHIYSLARTCGTRHPPTKNGINPPQLHRPLPTPSQPVTRPLHSRNLFWT